LKYSGVSYGRSSINELPSVSVREMVASVFPVEEDFIAARSIIRQIIDIVAYMVAAPNERIGVLTQAADRRRFNVATSRAKDQMWLFHSVTTNHLSVRCFRRRLLNYFRTRGLPREQFAKKVDDLVAVMARKGYVTIYKSKNVRIKLGWEHIFQNGIFMI